MFDSIQEPISVQDRELINLEVNNKTLETFAGRTPLTGKKCYEVFQKRNTPCESCPALRAFTTKDVQTEVISYTLNGEGERFLEVFAYPVFNNNDEVESVIEYKRDITERLHAEEKIKEYATEWKQREKKLELLLHEREILLREMNHRVKNNLIMINSLINLKEDEQNGNLELADLKRQIDAVRYVHESLYKSKDITYINFKEFISNILRAAFSLVRGTVHIDINFDIEYIHFNIAFPIGLLINELAANAMKHGFREGHEMTFTVNVQIEKGTNFCILLVSNTGKPFPHNISLDNPETLGLRLLSALTEQIYGTIELQRTPHPVYTIRFPLDVT